MKTTSGIRCDSCSRIEGVNVLRKDRRPNIDSRDRFFDFVMPPNGSFRGIASESEPRALAALHACPGCKDKVRLAIAKKDPDALPHGPLRDILTIVRSKDRLRDLGVS